MDNSEKYLQKFHFPILSFGNFALKLDKMVDYYYYYYTSLIFFTLFQMKKEIVSVYERVKLLCTQLKQRTRENMDSSRLENLPLAVQQVKVRCNFLPTNVGKNATLTRSHSNVIGWNSDSRHPRTVRPRF